MSKMWNIYLE